MEEKTAKTPNAGKVFISQDESGIKLYEHQKKAFDKMTKKIVQSGQYPYKGLLVLPTGGGKTMTAARWISENILDKGIKVLWLAHRHELLEQAKKTFTVYLAYKDIFKNKKELNWRLVSGIHDMAVNIKPDDDIIFASKDSVSSEKSFGYLKNHFLKGQEEIFLVIDEAIDDLIRYYLLTGETPVYYEFKDREKYDVGVIAQYIIDQDFGSKSADKYIDEKWAAEQGGWKTFFDFTIKDFRNEIDRAKARILHPEDFEIKHEKPQEILEDRRYEDYLILRKNWQRRYNKTAI